ncbi:MAG TPA: hypothetical protein VGH32_03920 [Pirellulales bacterium]
MDIPDFLGAVAILITGLAAALLVDAMNTALTTRVRDPLRPNPRRVKVFVAVLIVADFILLIGTLRYSLHYPALLISSMTICTIAIQAARRWQMKKKAARSAFEYRVPAETIIRFQGRRYPVGVNGIRAMQLVIDMANAAGQEAADPLALVRFRRRVREVMEARARAVLAHFAVQTRDPACRRVAVWLRGRCRGTLGTVAFGRLWANADLPLRKELTRALKRIDAWDYLRRIEQSDPDPRVRHIARQPAPQSFHGRLVNFLSGVTPSDAANRVTPLFMHDDVALDGGRPAKPQWLIRRLLEHIRTLVHGPRESVFNGD